MANVTIGWAELWSWLKGMPIEGLRGIGQELNGDDFTRWIESRSPITQVEVLENAPEPIQQHFYSKNVLSLKCIMDLGIRPAKNTILIDNRK